MVTRSSPAPLSRAYRAVWRWHFYAGVLVMPFLMLLALTGALYLFKDEIDQAVTILTAGHDVKCMFATPKLLESLCLGLEERGTSLKEVGITGIFSGGTEFTPQWTRFAVEELFEVKVSKVRTQTRKGKIRRYRNKAGRRPDWKKAIVQLHEDHRIDFF